MGCIFINMEKIVRLTESDIKRIVNKVISESSVNNTYFKRRGIDISNMLVEILSETKVCKYSKLTTYFNHIMERIIVRLYLHNEIMKNEFESEEDSLENKIREFLVEEKLDYMIYYYKLKCGREPKY